MSAPPATSDPAPAPAGTAEAPAPLMVSEFVQDTVDRLGAQPVPVTTLVEAILRTHTGSLGEWDVPPVSWPRGQQRQPADRWIDELRPLVSPGEFLFDGLAVTCLLLLDGGVARAAERSGAFFAVARELESDLGGLLTPAGVRLLQGRTPIAALAFGLLPVAVERPPAPEDGPLRRIALARQPQAEGVARWAAGYERGFYVGNGPSAARVLEGSPVSALGWSERNQVYAVLTPSSGPGLMRYDPAAEELTVVDGWAPTETAAVTEDAIVVATDRALLWGPADSSPSALDGLTGPFELVVAAREQIAVVSNHRLQVRSGHGWLDAGNAPPGTVLAATERTLVVGGDNGEVRGLVWSADLRGQKTASIPQAFAVTPFPGQPPDRSDGSYPQQWDHDGEPITALAAAGDLTVAATQGAVAVLHGNAVVARWPTSGRVLSLALSPDATALAVATDGDLQIWRIDGQRDLRLTSYTSDSPEGDDLLGIDSTVDALAALIAARALTPPLSVGLFGAWGSGKSFFMRRLEERVTQVADESRNSGRRQRSLWAWRNIRQVRFNAWNYASADVWAGLLEQLVRQLSTSRSAGLELPAELAELQRRRVERLTGAQAAETVAGRTVEQAEQHLSKVRLDVEKAHATEQQQTLAAVRARDKAARELVSSTVRDSVTKAVAGAGLTPVTDSAQLLVTEVAAARRSVASLHGLVRGGGRWWLVLAVLAGPALALLTAWLVPSMTTSGTTITTLAGTLAALAGWLGHATAWVDSRVRALDAAEAEALQNLAAAQREARAAELRAAEASAALAAAESEAIRAAKEVAVASARAMAAGAGDLLVEYLEGRQTSEDYRSKLGLIGTVRADLEVISDAVAKHNTLLADDDVVNRVVLYIDDLDRCPPTVVVKVLEAVHLLLSYPLFVVVVAVDAHWVSTSLATVYPTLLAGGGVTPDNYLEKIFQLPVWLDPPTPEAATAMALALLDPPEDDTTGDPLPAASTATPGAEAGAIPLQRTPSDVEVTGPRPVDRATSAPSSIVVEPDERTAIGRLAPLLARSPRALKRYLNTYRLLKAVLPTEDLARARLLLAVATGRPSLGERLLDQVSAGPPATLLATVVGGWPAADSAWFTANVPASVAWRDLTCGELRPSAGHVRRFVFRASTEPAAPALSAPGPSDEPGSR